MHKNLLILATILGALSVALGAFAAHTLKNYVSNQAIATFETAVRYQFYHVFAMVAVAILYKEYHQRKIHIAGWLFFAGILLFSGSLYFLAVIQGSVQPGYKWVGAITPFGGLCFIAGWVWMMIAVIRKK